MHNSRWAGQNPQSTDSGSFNRQSLFGRPVLKYSYFQTSVSDMVVCNFYQRGACKFGESCKNEHPGSQRDSNRGFGARGGGFGGGSNNNRFNAFGSGDSYRPAQPSSGTFGRNNGTPRFHLDKVDMNQDLSSQRPIYPLSCYGPGRDAPRQLIEGPVEVSPEELRSRYYLARAAGQEVTAQQEENQLAAKMEEQVKTIRNDLDGAIKYVEAGADIHPNRNDIAQGKAPTPANAPTGQSSSNPFSQPRLNAFGGGTTAQNSQATPAFGRSTFGQPTNPGQTTSALGQTSNPGQTTSAFGQPSNPGQATSAFGQPPNPGQTTSAFGQPSNPGQTTSAFGQPSVPGQNISAFGQTSTPAPTTSAFGQPSALGFGKPSMPGTSAFGQTGTPVQTTAFGQPSAPGATSAFGKPSIPGQVSAFGQANILGQNSGGGKAMFGQSTFGQASQAGTTASPFGAQQPQASKANPFAAELQNNQSSTVGQQSQNPPANPFGQATQQQNSTKPNPFGGAASQPSAFAQVGAGNGGQTPTALNANPFGAKTQNQAPSAPNANPFGQKAPAATTSAFSLPGQNPSIFGQPAQQQNVAQQAQSIASAPTAAPVAVNGVEPKDRLKEGKPEEYEGERGKLLEEIYKRVAQIGLFDDNEDIPLTPPKCEWITPAFRT